MVNCQKNRVEQAAVSIIVRTVDGRSDFLDRALFSIFCNTYKDKEVVIVYQGTRSETIAEICSISRNYHGLPIRIIQNPTNEDKRADNLNIGMHYGRGRFLAILDDDDMYYPNHLSCLIKAVLETGHIWAYARTCIDFEINGKVCRKEFPEENLMHFSFSRLLQSNYIPSHTFIVDRTRLPSWNYLFTNPELSRNEDYYIILKLAYLGEPIFCNEVTTSYSIRGDHSQTNIGIAKQLSDPELKLKNRQWHADELDKWVRSEKIIEEFKGRFIANNYWLKEFLNINNRKD